MRLSTASIYPVNWQATQPEELSDSADCAIVVFVMYQRLRPDRASCFEITQLPNHAMTQFSRSYMLKSDRWIRKMAREHDMINPSPRSRCARA